MGLKSILLLESLLLNGDIKWQPGGNIAFENRLFCKKNNPQPG